MEVHYILSDNAEHVAKIQAALKRNEDKYGNHYCPCVLPKFHSDDTVCPCKKYRETGVCCCGLYKNETEE